VGLQRQSSSASSPPPTLPPPSTLALPQSSSLSLDTYRDPLPPIQSTPSSSRAHSPVPSFAQLQLPPLDPALIAASGYANRYQRGGSWREPHGRSGLDPAKDFDSLTLSSGSVSAASSLAPSRLATPRTVSLKLSPDGDGGGDIDDIRRQFSNERDMKSELKGPGRMDVDGNT
jgi:transcriptional repressor OPI1